MANDRYGEPLKRHEVINGIIEDYDVTFVLETEKHLTDMITAREVSFNYRKVELNLSSSQRPYIILYTLCSRTQQFSLKGCLYVYMYGLIFLNIFITG